VGEHSFGRTFVLFLVGDCVSDLVQLQHAGHHVLLQQLLFHLVLVAAQLGSLLVALLGQSLLVLFIFDGL